MVVIPLMFDQMMDGITELLGVGSKIRDACTGADAVKTQMRTRMDDYESVLKVLSDELPGTTVLDHELGRLTKLFGSIQQLHGEHTAGPEDGKLARISKIVGRGTQRVSITEALDEIDKEVFRQFAAIAAKSSVNSMPIQRLLADLRPEWRRINTRPHFFITGLMGGLLFVFAAMIWAQQQGFFGLIRELRPPPPPRIAAVPAGVPSLPRSYLERPAVRQVIEALIDPDEALAPYTVVGMGGGGKTVLVSAVVRNFRVREHFRGGIFWKTVGKPEKHNDGLALLLEDLAWQTGATLTHDLKWLSQGSDRQEQIKHQLARLASTNSSLRLVVLDNVWERGVVDSVVQLGFKVLVTTRDRSVVDVPGGRLDLGSMTQNEALELLMKTSNTVGQPGHDARKSMIKVRSVYDLYVHCHVQTARQHSGCQGQVVSFMLTFSVA